MSAASSDRITRVSRKLHLPPRWSVAIALAAACAVVAWLLVSSTGPRAAGGALHLLLWPGAAVFASVYVFAWLGWALDID